MYSYRILRTSRVTGQKMYGIRLQAGLRFEVTGLVSAALGFGCRVVFGIQMQFERSMVPLETEMCVQCLNSSGRLVSLSGASWPVLRAGAKGAAPYASPLRFLRMTAGPSVLMGSSWTVTTTCRCCSTVWALA